MRISTTQLTAASRTLSIVLAAGLWAYASSASAVVLLDETFDTDVANTAAFNLQYPTFATSGPNPISVAGGVATITNGTGSNDTTIIAATGYTQEIFISADIGALSSNGSYNVGFQIGANNVVFHPGFGGGALRVEGPNGFGNTNMGFTPANGVLHQLEVHQLPTGQFDITFTDGSNPLNVFNASFTNLGSVGGPIGLRRSGPVGTAPGQGLFDNFLITDTTVSTPEPSTAILATLGLFGLGMTRRRRRR